MGNALRWWSPKTTFGIHVALLSRLTPSTFNRKPGHVQEEPGKHVLCLLGRQEIVNLDQAARLSAGA